MISVIVPLYNVEQYLERCVNSILASTYTNLEIILVDDGSTDRSGEICDKYAEKDSRVRAVHKENGGASSARNKGLDIARGKYIGFVDSDDTIEADMYRQLYDDMMENNAQISMCGCNFISEKRTEPHYGTKKFYVWDRDEAIRQLLTGRKVEPSLCNKLYGAELFSDVRLDEKLAHNEDYLANYFLMKGAKRVVFRDVCLYEYRSREGSVTAHGFRRDFFDIIDAARQSKADIEKDLPHLSDYGIRHLAGTLISCYNHSLPYAEYAPERAEFVRELKELKKVGTEFGRQQQAAMALLAIHPKAYAMALKIRKILKYLRQHLNKSAAPLDG